MAAATVLVIGPREPYPTGSPPDNSLVPTRTQLPPQLRTAGANWPGQSEANLAAGGMIEGGAPWVP
jgi:hypothetical protein